MNSPIITREKIEVELADEILRFAFKVGTILCPLVGIWAVSCLVAALMAAGPRQLLRGYITAITGF